MSHPACLRPTQLSRAQPCPGPISALLIHFPHKQASHPYHIRPALGVQTSHLTLTEHVHPIPQTPSPSNTPGASPPALGRWKLSRTGHFIMHISTEHSLGAPEKAQSELQFLCRDTAEFPSQHLFLPSPRPAPYTLFVYALFIWAPSVPRVLCGGSRQLGGYTFQLRATCLKGFQHLHHHTASCTAEGKDFYNTPKAILPQQLQPVHTMKQALRADVSDVTSSPALLLGWLSSSLGRANFACKWH